MVPDQYNSMEVEVTHLTWKCHMETALLEPQYTIKDLINKMVIALCNIEPGFSRGFFTLGVLLCAKIGDQVELISPPLRAKPGDKVYAVGFSRGEEKVEKIFCPGDWRNETRSFTDMKYVRLFDDNIAPDLRVDSEKRVTYRGDPLRVEGSDDFLTTQILSDCPVTYVDFEEPLYPGQK